MKKFEWDPKLETGISDVDIQHRVLFNIARILVDALENERENEVIDGILIELSRYTRYHSATEEDHHIGSEEDLAEHKSHHKQFISDVDGFKDLRKTMTNREFANYMLEFVQGWIKSHITQMDMRDLPSKK